DVPTNMPMIRIDDEDEGYRTAPEKFRAILARIEDCKTRGQPVLVGTTSIEKSEQLAEMLRKQGWEQHDFSDPNAFAALYSGDEGASKAKVFAVLNARYHEQEAQIIAQAGVPGAITIATNMAGRGTDIQLGGNADMRIRQELSDIEDPHQRELDMRAANIRAQIALLKEKALAAGGLYVLGTERHESRRIDNQLRGRSGRQGDPGHSRFFLSLEDDLMRIFGSDKLDTMLQRLGLKENEAIVHSWINKALEKTVLLQILDHLWREHLVMLEHLRQVIGLRGYGQRDPLNEYKAESFNLFEAMGTNLREAVTSQLMRLEIVQGPPADQQQNLP